MLLGIKERRYNNIIHRPLRQICLLCFCTFWAGCFGGDADIGDTLNGQKILVMGHGGSGVPSIDNYYPLNSKSAILQGVNILGADGVEIDVQLSADSILVLYHDAQLETQTDCQGCIFQHSFKEIASCRYRSNIALHLGQMDSLWTLEALLADFAARKVPPRLNIDLDTPLHCDFDFSAREYFRTLARQISQLIDQYHAESWVYIELRNLEELLFLQALHPTLNLVWLGPVDQQGLEIANANGFWGVVVENDGIDKTMVEEAHRQGLGVILYNVKIRQGMLKAVEKGPDMIETDNIPLLHAVLE